MRLYSITDPGITASFAEAVTQGIARDGGLYMPARIPRLPNGFLERPDSFSFQETALLTMQSFLEGEIPDADLRMIIEESITFPAPVRPLADRMSVLELFHGPTLAFKDFGARFLARTLRYLHRNEHDALTILVATSGDTGSAVGHGFHNVPGIEVVLLYPSGRVSRAQELQLTTIGGNVTALEIAGTFDDCQRLVKRAFADRALARRRRLTSANSINIARLLPQIFYYLEAYARLRHRDMPLVFSVPSGNLGNLTAGLLAWRMGIPVARFLAATNANNVLTRFLRSGRYVPAGTLTTLSNAMDVGDPSNFGRVMCLFEQDLEAARRMIFSESFTDDETRRAIDEAYRDYAYVLDPHGAVAFAAFQAFLEGRHSAVPGGSLHGVILETAHPAKFLGVYPPDMLSAIEMPERLREHLTGDGHSVRLSAAFEELKSFLMNP